MKKLMLLFLILAILTLCACSNATSNGTGGNEAVGGVNGETQNEQSISDPTVAGDKGDVDTSEATTEPEMQESTEPSAVVDKLSAWGLAEPSFSYEYVGYSEGTKGPDMVGKFYYIATADFAAAQAYAELVSNSGWGGSIPDPAEACSFGYTGDLDDYRLWIYWEEDGSVLISVTDDGVSAVWDDEANTYVLPEYGEYGSYGEYNADYMYG